MGQTDRALGAIRGSGCSVRRVDAGAPYDAPTSQGVDAFPALLAAVGVPAPLTAWGKWGDMTAARRRPAEAPETVEFKERLQWDDGAGKGCMHQGGGVLADRLRWCGHSRAHESQTAREVQAGQGRPGGLASSVMVDGGGAGGAGVRLSQRFRFCLLRASDADVHEATYFHQTSILNTCRAGGEEPRTNRGHGNVITENTASWHVA